MICKRVNLKKIYNEIKEYKRNRKLSQMQEALKVAAEKGKKIIVLSNDCTGGRVMKDFSMPSYTPTVNNWYSAADFLKICRNPDYYFSCSIEDAGIDADGKFTGKLDDIYIHFGHSSSYQESVKKWKIGCKSYFRARKSNHEICVIMNDRNGFEESLFNDFNSLPYIHKMIFTHKQWKNVPDSFYMDGEDALPYVDVMTRYENKLSTKRRYDRFDFFKWFMEIYNSN